MQIKISRAQTGNCETDKDGDRAARHDCGLWWGHAAASAHGLANKPPFYKIAFENVRDHGGCQKYKKVVLPTPEWGGGPKTGLPFIYGPTLRESIHLLNSSLGFTDIQVEWQRAFTQHAFIKLLSWTRHRPCSDTG